MKPINELSGAGLAEAVWIEVLGEQLPKYAIDRPKLYHLRDSVEQELERRGFEWEVSRIDKSLTIDAPGYIAVVEHYIDPGDKGVFHQNKFRAIAEAALEAVRGEG